MRLPPWPLAIKALVTADGAVKATPITIWKIQLNGGSDVAAIELTNDANGLGTNEIVLKAPIGSTTEVSYVDVGGIVFDAKCYADITGTAMSAYIWYTNQ